MIYPFENVSEQLEEEYSMPKEYGINFETGQLSGKIVEGLEAIKVWAWLTIKTAANKFYIYSPEYGQGFDDLIGKSLPRGIAEEEIKRMCEECLTQNEAIEGIDDFSVEMEDTNMKIKFTMITNLGGEEVEVYV